MSNSLKMKSQLREVEQACAWSSQQASTARVTEIEWPKSLPLTDCSPASDWNCTLPPENRSHHWGKIYDSQAVISRRYDSNL